MSAIRMLVAGISALLNFMILMLLIFCNGVVMQPLTQFVFSGSYKVAFGINMIPIIQGCLMFMALMGALVSIYVVWQEVFSEVSYYPEY